VDGGLETRHMAQVNVACLRAVRAAEAPPPIRTFWLSRTRLVPWLRPARSHGRPVSPESRIVGSGERHGGARISALAARRSTSEPRRVAARNQIIPSPERRGDFIRIEVVDRIFWDHELCDSCRPRSAALQRALIGSLDVLTRRRHSGRCDTSKAKRLILRRR